mgnify:FL=1
MRRLTVVDIKKIADSASSVVANGGNKGETWESLGCSSPLGSLFMSVRPKRKEVNIQIKFWKGNIQFRSTPFGVSAEGAPESEGTLLVRFYPDEQMEYGSLSRENNPTIMDLTPHEEVLEVVNQLKTIFGPLMVRGLQRGRNGYIKVFKP